MYIYSEKIDSQSWLNGFITFLTEKMPLEEAPARWCEKRVIQQAVQRPLAQPITLHDLVLAQARAHVTEFSPA